jgi:MFS family permease
VHGGSYVLFSQVKSFGAALVFMALSRAGVGFSSVMNMAQLLRHVPDQFRGRVFATMETTTWSVMMISMLLAGVASQYWDPRPIGTIAGVLSSMTAVYWGWADLTGRLPEPPPEGVEPEEIEIHGEPTV